MADDDVTALLSGKKKRKKHKRKRCRVVKRTKVVHGKRKTVKVRKCKPRKKAKPKPKAPVYVAPAFVPAPPVPPPPAPPRLKTIKSPIAVYQGAFGPAQANRLAWRAGFGPRPGQVAQLAALDLEAAVMSFTRPTGDAPLDGPEPMNGTSPINPASDDGAFNYWLDRMVRSRHQLVERLALVFHDWWATRRDGVNTNAEMLNQTNIFRAHGLGSFRAMTRAVTTDPAMLQFLDGMSNRRGAVNENYGRELMELFTLGADRGAYTRDRRARDRQGAQRLDGDLQQRLDQLALGRAGPLGLQHQDRVRQVRPLHVGGRGRARAHAPAAPVVLRPQALGLLHPGAAGRRDVRRARAPVRRERAADPARCSRRSSARRSSTRARRWSSRRSS